MFQSKQILYNLRTNQSGWQWILMASVALKVFYLVFNRGVIGPDAIEYLSAGEVFREKGIGYLWSNSPFTFWRLPLLPLLLALTGSNLIILYFIQLILTYFVAYNIYIIFRQIKFSDQESLAGALFSLFIPYLNIAACSAGVEFLQLFLLTYITRKLVCDSTDHWVALALTALCFLRAEGFLVVLLVLIRNISLKHYQTSLWLVLPLLCIVLWQYRNEKVFGSFSNVNPILSSRALIGSIYGVIYVDQSHPFHNKYNYYEGFDYLKKKDFVRIYKQVVEQELKNYITRDPLGYIKHRLYWVSKCFSYLSLHGEHMPAPNWSFTTSTDRQQVLKNNLAWGFGTLTANKDYVRLFIRLLYNGSLMVGHFVGLFFIILNFRKTRIIIFMLSTFGFLLIVEADMRYFIFVQMFCLCMAFLMLIRLKNRIFASNYD